MDYKKGNRSVQELDPELPLPTKWSVAEPLMGLNQGSQYL